MYALQICGGVQLSSIYILLRLRVMHLDSGALIALVRLVTPKTASCRDYALVAWVTCTHNRKA